jgi:hypothetical protein
MVFGDLSVYLLLGAIVLVFVIIKFFDNRMRMMIARLLADLAQKRFMRQDADAASVERNLQDKFRLNLARDRIFSGVVAPVTDGEITLFGCWEDKGKNKLKGGVDNLICAMFELPNSKPLYFLRAGEKRVQWIGEGRDYYCVFPKDFDMLGDEFFNRVKKAIEARPPKHYLSVSFNGGLALIYLKPIRGGLLNAENLEYLYTMAKDIKKACS